MTAAIIWALAATIAMQAQTPLPIKDGEVIPLWNGAAPEARGSDESDIPALTVYLPRAMAAPTPAMIVCPGGGYGSLASNHEGRQPDRDLAANGRMSSTTRCEDWPAGS